MGDECEEVTMIMAAETARNRRYDDVLRRRPRQQGDDKHTQTDADEQSPIPPSRHKERGATLLSYMAFSLVIGTLCQFKFLIVSMDTEHSYYIYIFVALILTLILQCVVAYILLYMSTRKKTNANEMTLTLMYSLTALIASVTFINISVFALL